MSNAIELAADDFTAERFKPLFESVWRDEAKQPFDQDHFFFHWQRLMKLGVAKTWAYGSSAALGALFVPDIFSGILRVGVQFWFALPSARHTGATKDLFVALEKAAAAAKALDIHVGAHQKLHPSRREYQYLKHGFVKAETMYKKDLVWQA